MRLVNDNNIIIQEEVTSLIIHGDFLNSKDEAKVFHLVVSSNTFRVGWPFSPDTGLSNSKKVFLGWLAEILQPDVAPGLQLEKTCHRLVHCGIGWSFVSKLASLQVLILGPLRASLGSLLVAPSCLRQNSPFGGWKSYLQRDRRLDPVDEVERSLVCRDPLCGLVSPKDMVQLFSLHLFCMI